ncbi:MAG TPA: hypothetical protein VFU05_18595 [Cyclobacteriaceae bacterium]|nr:hypothetical protein [Cyclobacteriaceae bacterium]
MKALTSVLLITFSTGFSQAKFEIREFTGKVKSIQPGWGFALEVIELEINDEVRYFRLDPIYGQSILSKIEGGQTVSLKANVNIKFSQSYKKKFEPWMARFTDEITELKMNDQWIQTPAPQQIRQVKKLPDAKVFLEQKVESDFFVEGLRKALIFKDGMVSFASYIWVSRTPMTKINPGDVISFMGFESPVKESYLFPIQNVKSVYSFVELKKMIGTIDSYIYKQNYVRIGMVVNGKRFSFQAEKARDIERLANGETITIYYDPAEDPKNNILPTIHALVQKKDTIFMPSLYYGGPDGKHEFKSVQVEGTISKLNRSEKGRIISIILNKDCYIEVDPQMEQQLGSLLKKGNNLKISGEERIKKEGEIYEKDYRIITPKRIVAESGEFILNR